MEQRSKWIWCAQETAPDEYAEFCDTFAGRGETVLEISADSNYAVYLNGALVASGQYPDFPYDKVYDRIDLTEHCREGENRLCIVVWYYGTGNMGYYPGKAALRYAVLRAGEALCISDENTRSRKSRAYAQGRRKMITSQLGYSFLYDMTHEDDWLRRDEEGFEPSYAVQQELPMRIRPCKRPLIQQAVPARVIKNEDDRHVLVDLGREYAGFLTVDLQSDEEQDILVAYGEHIADGGVRRQMGGRDFSVEMRLRAGENVYVNPFRRLGLRYLELFAQKPVQIRQLSILPVEYPLGKAAAPEGMDDEQRKIYDVCVRTLKMCMHEHYEDTPWREQALYAMDGRNQMLCGYYVFEEYEFPRANLLLMSRDERADGLLSICTPSRHDLTIPSFSLHYFTQILEYTRYSGDDSLAAEVLPKLKKVMRAFTDRLKDGLVPVFTQKCHWNFYEWSKGLEGTLGRAEESRFDAALNFLLVIALRALDELCRMQGEESDYGALAERVCTAAHERFYDPERGAYRNGSTDDDLSELVNGLAILSGAAQGERASAIAKRLAQHDNGMTKATLSMLCFKYDALLRADEGYKAFVLQDISEKYGRMLENGATTFWETELGQSDFDNAGSLCHGWSAMPVYYYHTLLK